MTKLEFVLSLRDKLSGLPEDEVREHLNFYVEMIEDRVEDGLSEEEAVSDVGTVDEIAGQIIGNVSHSKTAKERIKPKRRLKAWEIVLLILGYPLWLSLVIAAAAVIFSLYVSLWSVIASLWASFGALVASSLAGTVSGIVLAGTESVLWGIAMIGAGMVCAGLSVLMFFGCKALTKGMIILTKKTTFGIKNCFIKKEES